MIDVISSSFSFFSVRNKNVVSSSEELMDKIPTTTRF